MSQILDKEIKEFWIALEPYIYSPFVREAAVNEVDQIVRLLDLPSHAKILDIPCGPGRHSLELSRRGFQVTGCDILPEIIQSNHEKSQESNLFVNWVVDDLLCFCSPNTFDTILNLFYSFGFSLDVQKDQMILDNMFKSIKPGGSLVMQLIGRDIQEKWFYPKYWNKELDGAYLLLDKKFEIETGILTQEFTILKNKMVDRYQISTHVYYPKDIVKMLEKVGFKECHIFGGLDQRDYNEFAESLVVVAKKPFNRSQIIRC